MEKLEWLISQGGEGAPIELDIGPAMTGVPPHRAQLNTVNIDMSPHEAEMLGAQLMRRARENGAAAHVLDNPSPIHNSGAIFVLLSERERAMISNAFFAKRRKNLELASMLKKIREWL